MRRLTAKAAAYIRLAKLDIVDYYLSVAVIWTQLPPATRLSGRALFTLAAFGVSEVCLLAAMVTFDDVTGYRDGSDAINYGPDAPARRLARKPLLAGTLNEAEAIRFGWTAAGAGALLWWGSMVAAPDHPRWVVLTAWAYLLLSVQYSWGLKISYRGGQELFLAGLGVVLVLLPYGLLTGRAGGFVVVQAMLFGLGPLLFGVYSNTNDVAGDKRVGRLVAATVLSRRGNAIFIGAVSLAEPVLIIGSSAIGLAPWWFPLAMVPVMVLRTGQLLTGLRRGDILRARRIGIRAHRAAAATLVIVNLICPVISKGGLLMTDLDVAVVGAGPAGLAAAYALQKAGRSVQVLEAADRIGGRMRTFRHDGYLVDEGAEMITTRGYRATWDLIRELGVPLPDIPRVTNPLAIWRDGKPHRHVAHPLGLLTGAGLSPLGRLDLLRFGTLTRRKDAFDPDRPEDTPLGEMTIADLAARYRPEIHDYLFQPMAGAFFGWDTRRCAAAPFAAHMRATGSALNWRTYAEGMDTLARRLAERLQVTTGSPVLQAISEAGSARLVTGAAVLTARTVVLAVPAPAALAVHVNAPEDERRHLAACTFAARLRVSCLLDRPLEFPSSRGIHIVLFPSAENALLSTINLEHNKCEGRAPAGRGLVTMLASPVASGELIEAPDETVISSLTAQAERYLPGLHAATRAAFVHRFPHGMPEITPAALRLRPGFLSRPARPVEYAGDWLMLRPCSEGAFRAARLAVSRVKEQS